MRQVAHEMAAKKNSGSVMADNTMMKHKLSKQVGPGGAQLWPCICIGMRSRICSGPPLCCLSVQPCAALLCDSDRQKILHSQTAEGTSTSCIADRIQAGLQGVAIVLPAATTV